LFAGPGYAGEHGSRCWSFAFKQVTCVAVGFLAWPALPALAAEQKHRTSGALATFEDAMAAKQDVWGLAAMNQPNGASYEFLKTCYHLHAMLCRLSLLSHPAQFTQRHGQGARDFKRQRHQPLAGGARSWNDVGTPVSFRVGPDEFEFGSLRDRLSEPTLAEGWLPIVEIRYRHPTPAYTDGVLALDHPVPKLVPEVYRLEAFASTDPVLASNGVVFVKFDLRRERMGFWRFTSPRRVR